jgi:hypothetical protein
LALSSNKRWPACDISGIVREWFRQELIEANCEIPSQPEHVLEGISFLDSEYFQDLADQLRQWQIPIGNASADPERELALVTHHVQRLERIAKECMPEAVRDHMVVALPSSKGGYSFTGSGVRGSYDPVFFARVILFTFDLRIENNEYNASSYTKKKFMQVLRMFRQL